MDISIIFITIAVCYLIIKLAKYSKPRKENGERNKQNKSATKSQTQWKHFPGIDEIHESAEYFAWPTLNQFDFEVVGESYYQTALAKLAADHATISAGADEIRPLTAHLIPDDYNEYDDKAVRVEINNLHVGYLSREDARSFRRRLGAKKLTVQITTCGAIITGGHIKDGKTMSYGAALDIQPFGD